MTLNASQVESFRRILKRRDDELRKTIHDELLRTDDKTYAELAGRVQDPGEVAVADVLSDVQIAELRAEVEALADVEDALARIADGTYGVCQDCGQDIAPKRLEAYATAKRCRDCQARHENLAKDRTPSL